MLTRRFWLPLSLSFSLGFFASAALAAQPFVPGTGVFLEDCSDDFEDEGWSFRLNLPKSSYEQDERQRSPGGYSKNRLWHEGGKRGTPDIVRRVATPPGGIEGSTGALQFQTRLSGVPGRLSNKQQQDDLLMKFDRRLGRSIPIAWRPSATVRVYLPPFENWENRTGPSFGLRCDCRGRTPEGDTDQYWPGMFILFRSETSMGHSHDFAKLSIRANNRGHDLRSIDIPEPGWWTFGLSFTQDGQVHYYASEGVDDLTEEDFLMSNFPYSYRAVTFNNFFFNVANLENGRNWSTAWIIDDPQIFVQPPNGMDVAQLYRNKRGRRTATTRSSSGSTSNGKRTTNRGRSYSR